MDRPSPSDIFEKLPRGRNTPLPPPAAAAAEPAETPASRARRNATFWLLASTFVWAFALDFFVIDRLPMHFNEWVRLFRYPAMCWIASALLLRRRRSRKVSFAVINFVVGLASFARHF